MPPRHPRLPRLWLFTDERSGDALWDALARLPRGAGVVFRHHLTCPAERRHLLRRVASIARRHRLVLVIAGARGGTRGQGSHGGRRDRRRGRGLLTRAVHTPVEAVAARRAGADLVFVSPVFATRSHPGARALGPVRLGLLLGHVTMPAVALGGMDGAAMRRLGPLPLRGWAAIDAWTDEKRAGTRGSRPRVSAGGTRVGARRKGQGAAPRLVSSCRRARHAH